MRMGSCLALGVGIDSTYMAMGVYMLLLTALPDATVQCLSVACGDRGRCFIISPRSNYDTSFRDDFIDFIVL